MKNSRLKSFGISVILLIAGSFILNGCTQPYFPLTPEAEKMNAIPNPDKVSGCSELGEVKTVALTGELNSYRQAMNLMRNRLAEGGASHYSWMRIPGGLPPLSMQGAGIARKLKKSIQPSTSTRIPGSSSNESSLQPRSTCIRNTIWLI